MMTDVHTNRKLQILGAMREYGMYSKDAANHVRVLSMELAEYLREDAEFAKAVAALEWDHAEKHRRSIPEKEATLKLPTDTPSVKDSSVPIYTPEQLSVIVTRMEAKR